MLICTLTQLPLLTTCLPADHVQYAPSTFTHIKHADCIVSDEFAELNMLLSRYTDMGVIPGTHVHMFRKYHKFACNKFGLPSEVNVVIPRRCAGHSDKFVRYRTFLQGLNLLLTDHQVRQMLSTNFPADTDSSTPASVALQLCEVAAGSSCPWPR